MMRCHGGRPSGALMCINIDIAACILHGGLDPLMSGINSVRLCAADHNIDMP